MTQTPREKRLQSREARTEKFQASEGTPKAFTWAYNTTWKTTTGFTPYELVYGKKTLLSIEFKYNRLRVAAQLDLDLSHTQQERLL